MRRLRVFVLSMCRVVCSCICASMNACCFDMVFVVVLLGYMFFGLVRFSDLTRC